METKKNNFDLRPLLGYINPDEYETWLKVGMALNHEGYPVEVWEEWSRNSSKFKEGDCYSKWDSFRENTDHPVTGATITYLARQAGWRPSDAEPLPWTYEEGANEFAKSKSTISVRKPRDEYIPVKIRAEHALAEPGSGWNATGDALTYLRALYRPDDILNVNFAAAWDNEKKKWRPAGSGVNLKAGKIMEMLEQEAEHGVNAFDPARISTGYNPAAGGWCCINPTDGSGRKGANIADYRYTLIEADDMPLDAQRERLEALNLPIAAVVYSGGKSVHAVVKIGAKDEEEYKARVRMLHEYCKTQSYRIDEACKNAGRLTRFPGLMRGDHPQFLISTSCGADTFEDWSEWRVVRRLRGTMSDAHEALIDPPPLAPELIEGLLRMGHKMTITGASKAGKSWALIELAVALATGGDWMGAFMCRPCKVLYANMEIDPSSFIHRVIRVREALGAPLPEKKKLIFWSLRGCGGAMQSMIGDFLEYIRVARPAVVIIDPFYKVMEGDENAAGDVAAVLRNFDEITKEGCAVVIAHHHKKGNAGNQVVIDRGSGSGVFARDPDALLDFMECDEEAGWSDTEKPLYKVNATLREFPPHKPFGVRFDFPLHKVEEGALEHAAEKGSPHGGQIKGRNAQVEKKELRQNEIKAMIENRAKDGKETTIRYIADYFGVSMDTILRDLKAINQTWATSYHSQKGSGKILAG